MKKVVLQFKTIGDVAECAKGLQSGYIINTRAVTLTADFTEDELEAIRRLYGVVTNGEDSAPGAEVCHPN